MNEALSAATECYEGLYAIRLLPPGPAGNAPRIAGRVEHVLSGRCHDFADGAALLECLAFEQQQRQTATSGR